MKYDFTTKLERIGHDALAVDAPYNYQAPFDSIQRKEGFSIIPMWIADMNFPVYPNIQKSIIERVNHPTFGYYSIRDEYYEAIINWHKNRYGIEYIQKENIGYENGVLGGLLSALSILAKPGDSVLLHSPTYIGFTMSIKNAGYNIIHSNLKFEDTWRIDYQDMEEKIQKNHIQVAIFANPHNPCGRAWEKEELEKLMAIFEKYHVYVISDEIWADLYLYNNKHIPLHSLNEYAKQHTISLYAPSKTFNLSGLIGAYHIIFNDYLHKRILKASSKSHYNSMNVLSMHALIGAYDKDGAIWVDELKAVLTQNMDYATQFIDEHFQGVRYAKPQATYMLYLDCKDYCEKNQITIDTLLERAYSVGVYFQDGRPFNLDHSIRINLALPYETIKEAFNRLKDYVFI
ncbi:MAG: aminotransferase class I/II-fold pyridoxal phosphate-dependent enzyme [Lachnospiraceae bacterium]|nr:aminotransferase class I/II-fold pyridoxal phosphate-dependent enzyme [Lachnospiraceae bacterium]MBR2067627.1 aminotransferase class I/II-fold pyridoxal phosphate-dependent enzyme [Solobacterium sp.]